MRIADNNYVNTNANANADAKNYYSRFVDANIANIFTPKLNIKDHSS
jgi:hypothetical protein